MAEMKRRNVIGPQVCKLRFQHGWSQSDLAIKLQLCGWDVSRTTVAKIELRMHSVGDVHLLYLAEVLKVQVSDLLPKARVRGRTVHSVLDSPNQRSSE